MDRVPLFPLGTVVLPGVAVPLRIFEARYRSLLVDLRREPRPEFGVVAIRRGREAGQTSPEIHGVGCMLRITSQVDAGGHIEIETLAMRRFRVVRTHDDLAPYLVGDVTWLEDDDAVPVAMTTRAEAAFRSFARAVGARVDGLPVDPLLLTAAILDGLDQPIGERQAVLEAGTAAARIRAVTRLCRREEGLARDLGLRMATVASSYRLNQN
ncbi:MAG: LON peptidase substrate-binding domain-containing protein [Mobilicoccus sp.]|nr:LON peptidase substrate-binding domain-containing protein [Mobilicoccus sp.]